jgi:PleD family two-component response regulator
MKDLNLPPMRWLVGFQMVLCALAWGCVARVGGGDSNARSVIARADRALYRAEAEGRNCSELNRGA